MRKLILKSIIGILIISGLFLSTFNYTHAQWTPANFWKQVGDTLQLWNDNLQVSISNLIVTDTATTTKLCFDDGTCQTTVSSGASPLTTKGDLYGYTTTNARVPVGADGLCLVASSTQATGLAWGTCGSGGTVDTSNFFATSPIAVATTSETVTYSIVDEPTFGTTTINGSIDVDQFLTPYGNHVTVDADGGGDYTTIQEAFDSIIDAGTDNRYVVDVKCGEYPVNNLVIPNFVYLRGEDSFCVYLNSTNTNAIRMTSFVSGIFEVTIDADYPVLPSATSTILFDTPGFGTIADVRLLADKDTGDFMWSALEIASGNMTMSNFNPEYTNNSAVAGSAQIQTAVNISGDSIVKFIGSNIRATNNDSNDIIAGIGIASGIDVDFRMLQCENATDQNANALSANFYSLGSSTEFRIFHSSFDIDSPAGGTAYGGYLDSPLGASKILSYYNNYDLNGVTGTSNGVFVSTGDEWDSYFDQIQADSYFTGTGEFHYVASLENGHGSFETSGTTTAGHLVVGDDEITMSDNTAGKFLVADGSKYNAVAMSGDGTLDGAGALTIGDGALTPSTIALTQGYTLVGDASNQASATSSLYIDTTGDIGIGTTSPVARLDIDGYGDPVFVNSSGFVIGGKADFDGTAGLEFANASTGNSADMRFIIPDTAGNYMAFSQPGVNNAGTFFGSARNTSSHLFTNGRNLTIGAFSAHDTIFGTNNLEHMRLLSTGLFGIGNNAPTSKLTVTNTGANDSLLIEDEASDTTPFVIDQNGNVGIGTSTPSELLTVTTGNILQDIPNGTLAISIASTSVNASFEGPRSVTYSGKKMYVVCDVSMSMTIFDVTDPANPIELGSIADNSEGGTATNLEGVNSIKVAGDFAYTTSSGDTDDGISVFNISDPYNIVEVGTVVDGGGSQYINGTNAAYISGKYLWVTTDKDDSLVGFDISDPMNLVEAGFILDAAKGGNATELDGAIDLFVSGTEAHVVSRVSNSYSIFDISDPAMITEIATTVDDFNGGTATRLRKAIGVYVIGDLAYVTAETDGAMTIFDISQRKTGVITELGIALDDNSGGPFTNLRGAQKIYVANGVAMVTSIVDDGVTLIDVSSTTNPTQIQVLTGANLEKTMGIVMNGKNIYVVGNDADTINSYDYTYAKFPSIQVGEAVIGGLEVQKNLTVANSLIVDAGLNVGSAGIYSGGASSIYATSTGPTLTVYQGGSGNIISVIGGTTEVFTITADGNIGIGTTTPQTKLAVNGNITGNVYYGEMYMKNNATSTGIILQNTYYKIGDTGGEIVLSGLLNGMTHSNGTTTVLNAGVYRVVTAISANGGTNAEYHYSVAVNGVDSDNCHIPRKMSSAGDVGAMSMTCLFDLNANDEITVVVENVTNTTDVTINDMNLNIEYIGLPL